MYICICIRAVVCGYTTQMDHPISARRPDLLLIDKKIKTFYPMHFVIPQSENERKRKTYLSRELEKPMEHEVDGNTNCSGSTRNSYQIFEKGTGGIGNQRKNRNHADYSIVKIG